MALEDFVVERREHKSKGGSFSVGGLSLNAIAKLLHAHINNLDEIANLVDSVWVKDKDAELSDDQVMRVIGEVVVAVPPLAADLIILASGETPKDYDALQQKVMAFPGPLQIQVLYDIYELTFSEIGGIKKAWERVAPLLKEGVTKAKDKKALRLKK